MTGIASKGQLRASFLRWAIVVVPAIFLLGFLSGRSVPAGADNRWYTMLDKPAVTPPDWLFPVAWSILYLLVAIAFAIILNARGARGRGVAVALFVSQFVANLIWTPTFFGLHQIGWALAIIAVMLLLAVATTVAFGRIRPLAAWLMVPYLVWISFAGVLTFSLWRMNPDAASLVPPSARTQMTL